MPSCIAVTCISYMLQNNVLCIVNSTSCYEKKCFNFQTIQCVQFYNKFSMTNSVRSLNYFVIFERLYDLCSTVYLWYRQKFTINLYKNIFYILTSKAGIIISCKICKKLVYILETLQCQVTLGWWSSLSQQNFLLSLLMRN